MTDKKQEAESLVDAFSERFTQLRKLPRTRLEWVVVLSEVLENLPEEATDSEATKALKNILALTLRMKKKARKDGADETDLNHLVRFCEEGGVKPSPLRESESPKFVLLDEEKGQLGFALWWGPNQMGYTTLLDRAGRYELEEAQAIAAATKDSVQIVSLEDATRLAILCVRDEKVRKKKDPEKKVRKKKD